MDYTKNIKAFNSLYYNNKDVDYNNLPEEIKEYVNKYKDDAFFYHVIRDPGDNIYSFDHPYSYIQEAIEVAKRLKAYGVIANHSILKDTEILIYPNILVWKDPDYSTDLVEDLKKDYPQLWGPQKEFKPYTNGLIDRDGSYYYIDPDDENPIGTFTTGLPEFSNIHYEEDTGIYLSTVEPSPTQYAKLVDVIDTYLMNERYCKVNINNGEFRKIFVLDDDDPAMIPYQDAEDTEVGNWRGGVIVQRIKDYYNRDVSVDLIESNNDCQFLYINIAAGNDFRYRKIVVKPLDYLGYPDAYYKTVTEYMERANNRIKTKYRYNINDLETYINYWEFDFIVGLFKFKNGEYKKIFYKKGPGIVTGRKTSEPLNTWIDSNQEEFQEFLDMDPEAEGVDLVEAKQENSFDAIYSIYISGEHIPDKDARRFGTELRFKDQDKPFATVLERALVEADKRNYEYIEIERSPRDPRYPNSMVILSLNKDYEWEIMSNSYGSTLENTVNAYNAREKTVDLVEGLSVTQCVNNFKNELEKYIELYIHPALDEIYMPEIADIDYDYDNLDLSKECNMYLRMKINLCYYDGEYCVYLKPKEDNLDIRNKFLDCLNKAIKDLSEANNKFSYTVERSGSATTVDLYNITFSLHMNAEEKGDKVLSNIVFPYNNEDLLESNKIDEYIPFTECRIKPKGKISYIDFKEKRYSKGQVWGSYYSKSPYEDFVEAIDIFNKQEGKDYYKPRHIEAAVDYVNETIDPGSGKDPSYYIVKVKNNSDSEPRYLKKFYSSFSHNVTEVNEEDFNCIANHAFDKSFDLIEAKEYKATEKCIPITHVYAHSHDADAPTFVRKNSHWGRDIQYQLDKIINHVLKTSYNIDDIVGIVERTDLEANPDIYKMKDGKYIKRYYDAFSITANTYPRVEFIDEVEYEEVFENSTYNDTDVDLIESSDEHNKRKDIVERTKNYLEQYLNSYLPEASECVFNILDIKLDFDPVSWKWSTFTNLGITAYIQLYDTHKNRPRPIKEFDTYWSIIDNAISELSRKNKGFITYTSIPNSSYYNNTTMPIKIGLKCQDPSKVTVNLLADIDFGDQFYEVSDLIESKTEIGISEDTHAQVASDFCDVVEEYLRDIKDYAISDNTSIVRLLMPTSSERDNHYIFSIHLEGIENKLNIYHAADFVASLKTLCKKENLILEVISLGSFDNRIKFRYDETDTLKDGLEKIVRITDDFRNRINPIDLVESKDNHKFLDLALYIDNILGPELDKYWIDSGESWYRLNKDRLAEFNKLNNTSLDIKNVEIILSKYGTLMPDSEKTSYIKFNDNTYYKYHWDQPTHWIKVDEKEFNDFYNKLQQYDPEKNVDLVEEWVPDKERKDFARKLAKYLTNEAPFYGLDNTNKFFEVKCNEFGEFRIFFRYVDIDSKRTFKQGIDDVSAIVSDIIAELCDYNRITYNLDLYTPLELRLTIYFSDIKSPSDMVFPNSDYSNVDLIEDKNDSSHKEIIDKHFIEDLSAYLTNAMKDDNLFVIASYRVKSAPQNKNGMADIILNLFNVDENKQVPFTPEAENAVYDALLKLDENNLKSCTFTYSLLYLNPSQASLLIDIKDRDKYLDNIQFGSQDVNKDIDLVEEYSKDNIDAIFIEDEYLGDMDLPNAGKNLKVEVLPKHSTLYNALLDVITKRWLPSGDVRCVIAPKVLKSELTEKPKNDEIDSTIYREITIVYKRTTYDIRMGSYRFNRLTGDALDDWFDVYPANGERNKILEFVDNVYDNTYNINVDLVEGEKKV